MNTTDLRKLTPEEIVSRVASLRQSVFDLKIKFATGQLESTAKIRTTRRDLARTLTVQNEARNAG